MTFEHWMTAVNKQVEIMAMVSVDDLADQPFRDWFNDGISAREAAEMTLEDNGYPMDIF